MRGEKESIGQSFEWLLWLQLREDGASPEHLTSARTSLFGRMDEPQGGLVTLQLLGTLKRTDLESSFQALHQENLHLRKILHQQINETNRIRALLLELLSLVKSKKSLTLPLLVNSNEKSRQLYIELLNEKVSVLTQQLLDHSRFHSQVHKCNKRINWSQNIFPSSIYSLINKKCDQAILQLISRDDENNQGDKTNSKAIDHPFQDEVKKRSSEYELDGTCEMDKVLNNLDIIRLRRLIKRQAIQNATLSYHVKAAEKEASELKSKLNKLQIESEELTKQLNEEKRKQESLQSLQKELNLLRHSHKMLIEEIRNIKEEKDVLKETNANLLEELDIIRSNEEKNRFQNNKQDASLIGNDFHFYEFNR